MKGILVMVEDMLLIKFFFAGGHEVRQNGDERLQ
jgi:hypothetical protein